MKRFSKIAILAILIVAVVSSCAFAKVVVKGSDVSYKFTELAAKSYEKSADVTVNSQKKNAAITDLALGSGDITIATSTWSLEDLNDETVLEAIASAASDGITLEETPYVIDAIPPIVNKNNPVSTMTLEQLHQIYTGEITKWAEIDAAISPDIEIEVYTTGESDGKYIVWKDLVIKGTASDDVGTPGPKDIEGTIASDDHKWAIGFDSMYYVKDSQEYKSGDIKMVTITNPTKMKQGPAKKYPVSRYLYMILRSDATQETIDFYDYMFLPETQKLAYDVNQLPLSEKETDSDSSSGSSSGCNAAFPAMLLLALIPAAFFRKK